MRPKDGRTHLDKYFKRMKIFDDPFHHGPGFFQCSIMKNSQMQWLGDIHLAKKIPVQVFNPLLA